MILHLMITRIYIRRNKRGGGLKGPKPFTATTSPSNWWAMITSLLAPSSFSNLHQCCGGSGQVPATQNVFKVLCGHMFARWGAGPGRAGFYDLHPRLSNEYSRLRSLGFVPGGQTHSRWRMRLGGRSLRGSSLAKLTFNGRWSFLNLQRVTQSMVKWNRAAVKYLLYIPAPPLWNFLTRCDMICMTVLIISFATSENLHFSLWLWPYIDSLFSNI